MSTMTSVSNRFFKFREIVNAMVNRSSQYDVHYIVKRLMVAALGASTVMWLTYALRTQLKWSVCKFINRWYSAVVANSRKEPDRKSDLVRNAFRETIIPKVKLDDNPSHPHTRSAAWRSMAMNFCRTFGLQIGMVPYGFQASKADVRNGYDYSRQYYWMKDCDVPAASKREPDRQHIVTLVDVDYYCDIPRILLDTEQPVLLYTFQPSAVAKSVGEYSYRFDDQDRVLYKVNGGQEYCHQVWNYNRDEVTVCGFWTTKHYIVEKRKVDDDHELVLFIPNGSWKGPWAWLANWLDSNLLQPFRVHNNGFCVLDFKRGEEFDRSISKIGEYNCATMPIKTFEAIVSVSKVSSVKIGNATVQSWLKNDKHASAVMVDYCRALTPIMPDTVYTAQQGIREYQILNNVNDFNPDVKPLMKSFMSPVLPATFVPSDCHNNEQAAINGRVVKPAVEAQSIAESPPSKFLVDCMQEFVHEMFKNMDGKLTPLEVDNVYERQIRPAQRAILARAEAADEAGLCESFMKAEPYKSVKDPRMITTFDGVTKREYARFIYSLTDWVSKECSWYSFGKSPRKIAKLIAEVCQNSTIGVNAADANRMDGHVHKLVRLLEIMIFNECFEGEDLTNVLYFHRLASNIKVYGKHHIKYDLGDARGSGSAETALFNSILSKFMDFLARRLAHVDPETAYMALGQFGGDDSLASQITSDTIGGEYLVRAGAMVGQVIENVEFKHGSSGVNYLSRFYTDEIWFGRTDNWCDLHRALSKLHVAPNLQGVTSLEKLRQKLIGLSYTDGNTPIIKQILSAANRLNMDLTGNYDARVHSWWCKYEIGVNWPNTIGDQDQELIITNSIPHANCDNLFKYLDNCGTMEGLLFMPLIDIQDNNPPAPKGLAAVDDDIVNGSSKDELKPDQTPTKVQSQGSDICRAYINRQCNDKNCKSKHVKICSDFAKGKCARKKCKFAHLK